MKFQRLIMVLALLTWSSGPANAEPAQPVASDKARPPADPNQKICEDVTIVGSRLATKRICATRAEWARMRQSDRDEVERDQTQLCMTSTAHCK